METVKDTLDKYLNKRAAERLFMEEPVSFRYKKEVGAALYYPDNEGNFIVLILARTTMEQIQNHVLILILLLFIFSSISVLFHWKVLCQSNVGTGEAYFERAAAHPGNNLNIRIKTAGNHDELDDLITSINGMLDRMDAAFKSEKSFVSSASMNLIIR